MNPIPKNVLRAFAIVDGTLRDTRKIYPVGFLFRGVDACLVTLWSGHESDTNKGEVLKKMQRQAAEHRSQESVVMIPAEGIRKDTEPGPGADGAVFYYEGPGGREVYLRLLEKCQHCGGHLGPPRTGSLADPNYALFGVFPAPHEMN